MSFKGKSSRQNFEESAKAASLAYVDMMREKVAEVQSILKKFSPEFINPQLLLKADYGYAAISPEFSFSMKCTDTGNVDELTQGFVDFFLRVKRNEDKYPAGTFDLLKDLQKVSNKLNSLWSLDKEPSDFITIAQNNYVMQVNFKILGEKFNFVHKK